MNDRKTERTNDRHVTSRRSDRSDLSVGRSVGRSGGRSYWDNTLFQVRLQRTKKYDLIILWQTILHYLMLVIIYDISYNNYGNLCADKLNRYALL